MFPRRFLPAALATLILVGVAGEASAETAQLTAFDVLSRPGRSVTFKAKLETKGYLGINPDVQGESLDFFLVERDGRELEKPRFVGTGETNDDGVAEAEWKPEGTGQFIVEVRIRRGSEYVALPARLHLAVPATDRTIVLVQIDGTVSTATNVQMFRGTENEKIAAVEGSQDVLRTLGQHYQLVYLTDLELGFTAKFKEWLQLRNVPSAPVIFWELFERSLSHKTYMTKLVARLRKQFPQAAIGIGGSEADGVACVTNGLAGIVITDEPEELAPSVIPAEHWPQVLFHVASLHTSAGLLEEMASGDPGKRESALAGLCMLGRNGIAYVHRFRQAPDPNLAAAATLVASKLNACEAFYRSLDLSTANRALSSLLAAWTYGEPSVVVRLYRERKAGQNDPAPRFRSCEMVSRNEPEPAKVVFKIRLFPLAEDEEPTTREVVFVRGDDKTWRIDVEEF